MAYKNFDEQANDLQASMFGHVSRNDEEEMTDLLRTIKESSGHNINCGCSMCRELDEMDESRPF